MGEAMLGRRIPVPTMDGEAKVTIPPMFYNGKKLRLRSKGWLDNSGKRGDQYVKIVFDIPNSLNSAELKLNQCLSDLRKGANEP